MESYGKEIYEKICKYCEEQPMIGYSSSWAIWSDPDFGKCRKGKNPWRTKDSIDDLSVFEVDNPNNKLDKITGGYILVALNPAEQICTTCTIINKNACQYNKAVIDNSKQKWNAFHSPCKKKSQDYKLRYAVHGSALEGSFITDLFDDIVATSKADFKAKLNAKIAENPSYVKDKVQRVISIRNLINPNAQIVAIGPDVSKYIKGSIGEYEEIKHYSQRSVSLDSYSCEIKERFT